MFSSTPPDSLCILRLSAVGDICHTLPVVRTIQKVWPNTKLTWVIGKLEASLIGDISGINFIRFDKSNGLKAYVDLRRTLSGQSFDALLHMQMSLRSSIVNRLIRTNVRIGFDRARAKDLQWLFNNTEIPAHTRQHVLDSFFGFSEKLGIQEKHLEWNIPISEPDRDIAAGLVKKHGDYFVISPCSAMAYRNWNVAAYAKICDYLSERNITPVLTGGLSELEQSNATQIVKLAKKPPQNLIGKTSLKQLLAVLESAIGLVSPDSGPAHIATTVNTPVIGLYACTNPERARPYLSKKYCVNRYDEALMAKHSKPVSKLPWGTRIRVPGTMDRITVSDVIQKIDLLLSDLSLRK